MEDMEGSESRREAFLEWKAACVCPGSAESSVSATTPANSPLCHLQARIIMTFPKPGCKERIIQASREKKQKQRETQNQVPHTVPGISRLCL